MPTPSPSRVCSSATGCRRSRSASTRPTPPICIASSRTRIPSDSLRQAVPRRLGRLGHADDQGCCANSRPAAASRSSRTPWGMRLTALAARLERARIRMCASPTSCSRYAFVIPMSGRDDDHPVARADRRRVLLLVCDLHQLRPRRSIKQQMRDQRLKPSTTLPDYKPAAGASHNNYGFDVAEQADPDLSPAWATTSMSTTSGRWKARAAIQDRTREHLGTSDKAHRRSTAACSWSRRSSQAGQMATRPLMCARRRRGRLRRARPDRPIDGIGPKDGWQSSSGRTIDARRREMSSWAAATGPPLEARARDGAGRTPTGCGPTTARSAPPPKSRSASPPTCLPASMSVVLLVFADQHGVLRGKTIVAAACASTMR